MERSGNSKSVNLDAVKVVLLADVAGYQTGGAGGTCYQTKWRRGSIIQ